MKTLNHLKPLYPKLFPRTIIHLVICCCIRQATAQSYYPGGLGNTNLVIWLNARNSGSITKNGSNQVSEWSDLSGHGYDFTQSTNSNKPVYGATTGPNSRPALTFTSTNSQYLSLSSLPSSVAFSSGISTFAQVSFSASQTSWGWERVYDFGNGQASNNLTFGRYGSTANFYYEGFTGSAGDQTYTSTNAVVNGTSNIYEVVQQPAAAGNYTNVAFYLAGASQTGAGAIGAKTWIPSAMNRTKNYVGRSNWSADNYFSGTMSELLLYNVTFNTTQRVIMENYLSAEWGKSVSVSKYTPPSSTTYNTNLVGIGYTSSTDNFLTNPSGSTDGLGFSSSSGSSGFLNTAGYLMAAHNGQSNTVLTNVNVGMYSATSISRWNRSWYLQKTGGNSSGQVTLNFNFSDYNGTTPSGANNYALLYNATDGTFPNGTNSLVLMVSAPVVSGNIVSITVNASLLANGYYTIIYSATTLPVELKGFTATRQENSALLKWSVALESGIDHYEIQRGASANDFVTVGSVAAGNTNTLTAQYSFTDEAPAEGRNYYRLKIVDRDDVVKYSIVIPLDFPAARSGVVRLYPNPTADMLHIALPDAAGVVSVLVINTKGQVVRSVRSAAAGVVDISVSDLSKGIYIVEIDTGVSKYVQKIMKN